MEIDVSNKEDILWICSIRKMRVVVFEAIKEAVKNKIPILYMSFTKPASFILNKLAKEKIPLANILIIDCSGNKENKKQENVITIESGESLTNISIAAFRFIDKPNKKLLIIDAINVLMQYNRIEYVSKMLRNIIQKDDERMTKMLVFYTDVSNKKPISQIEPFFDKVLEEK